MASQNPYADKTKYPTARDAQIAFNAELEAAVKEHGLMAVTKATQSRVFGGRKR